jgi:predicted transposase YbfD/YdcC
VKQVKEIMTRHFGVIEDYRCLCDVKHKLTDILILVMCASLSGIDTIAEIVEYGEQKRGMLLGKFGIVKIPSEATLSRVLNMVNAEILAICIVNIMKELLGAEGEIIAIDGKAICSTDTMKRYARGLRIVTAYMTANGVSVGQLAVDSKSNEIPAVQELLDLLDIRGKIVTADAEHCQRSTMAKIIEKQGDYCVCVKGNQHGLYADVKLYCDDMLSGGFPFEAARTSEKNRERREIRECFLAKDISWLSRKDDWAGLESIFAIRRTTTKNGAKSTETSYYISSLSVAPEQFLEIVREHWKIESLHWQLDVVFGEDDCRIFSENGQKSMNMFRKIALAVHKSFKERTGHKKSIKKQMFACLLNDDVLLSVISS